MINKVLIISASAGGGHLRVAEALITAFSQKQAARQIYHIDALQYTPKAFRKFYSQTYFDLIRSAPDLVGWLYKSLDKPWKNDSSRTSLDKLNSRKLAKMLKLHDPDYIVCTHFLPATVISDLIERGKIRCKQAVVITDFHAHALWLCKNVDRYFVSTDEVKEHLVSNNILSENIIVTGIPIDPAFMPLNSIPTKETKIKETKAKETKANAIKFLNLPNDRKIILISAGGFGHGLAAEYLIESMLKMKQKAHIVAICGKNEKMKERLEEIILLAQKENKLENISVEVIGFTTQMEQYMSAADIVVGKPGGSTTAEAMAKGLAFVVVNPIPGQEVHNADYITEQGAAIRSNNLSTLAFKIDKLLDDEKLLKQMQQNALRISSADAAFKVVNEVLLRV